MRYDEQDRESSNVEDVRGRSRGRFRMPGGFNFPGGRGRRIRIPVGGRRGGFSLMTLLIVGALMLFFGINPLDLFRGGPTGGAPDYTQVPRMPGSERTQPRPQADARNRPLGFPSDRPGSANVPARDELVTFIKRVLADTEDVWKREFRSLGRRYREPKLVIYTGSWPTACGRGQAAMGPFYCPADQKIYIDLSFYEQLKSRFNAPGDFAQAYVIAHEVGHHIQMLLGIVTQVQQMKARLSKTQANRVQVRMELQADCLAGVWAKLNDQLKNRLEPGDIEEGLNAASAIGDDMIQRRATGRVVPDAFTHGSSEQRVRWFKVGFDSGRMQACDTFSAQRL
ncbi:MAG: neutral zinc metallopeptidase [Pseudomonadota bacterium]